MEDDFTNSGGAPDTGQLFVSFAYLVLEYKCRDLDRSIPPECTSFLLFILIQA